MDKICKQCGVLIKFNQKWSISDRAKDKFCSRECKRLSQIGVFIPNKSHFKKGHQPWNDGVTGYFSEEILKRATERIQNYIKNETQKQKDKRLEGLRSTDYHMGMLGKVGEDCPHWIGEAANYNSKHRWIQNHWTKTGTCEECREIKTPREGTRLKVATYWHNPSKTYRRERTEWMEVCAKCHYKLDRK